MLSIGWPEMLIVAAAALIVVGPRDLPALLRHIGRVVGQVRRMGNDFRSELNKVAALDDVRDIKRSITKPLTDTRSDIEKQFNKITPSGFEPSGVIKPSDPNAESVYDEIKSVTKAPEQDAGEAARAAMAAAVTNQRSANATEAAANTTVSATERSRAKPVTKAHPKAPGKTGPAGKSTASANTAAKRASSATKGKTTKSTAAAKPASPKTGGTKAATKKRTNSKASRSQTNGAKATSGTKTARKASGGTGATGSSKAAAKPGPRAGASRSKGKA